MLWSEIVFNALKKIRSYLFYPYLGQESDGTSTSARTSYDFFLVCGASGTGGPQHCNSSFAGASGKFGETSARGRRGIGPK